MSFDPYSKEMLDLMNQKRKALIEKYSWCRKLDNLPYKPKCLKSIIMKAYKKQVEEWNTILNQLKEQKTSSIAHDKEELIKMLEYRVYHLTFGRTAAKEDFMREIIPLMKLIYYYNPIPKNNLPEGDYETMHTFMVNRYPEKKPLSQLTQEELKSLGLL